MAVFRERPYVQFNFLVDIGDGSDQRAVQAGFSHRTVTLAVLGLDLVLAGLTWVGVTDPARMPAMIGLGGMLLLAAYLLVERRKPMYPSQ